MTERPAPEIDVTRTIEWIEPQEQYLAMLSPMEKMMFNNMRVLMREIQAMKQANETILELLVNANEKLNRVGRPGARSASIGSAETSIVTEVQPNDEDFFEAYDDLKNTYAKFLMDRKKLPRLNRGKGGGLDKDVKEFFNDFVPIAMGHSEEEPNQLVAVWQAAGLHKQRGTYLKLGRAYTGKDKGAQKKGAQAKKLQAKGPQRARGETPETPIELPSSQSSGRAARAHRRQERRDQTEGEE